ncbi:unnamed protein product [Adineta ricciae]|uniref:Uncharacterized protein n=1 Tax=Adineta ricciae TaxID=249248 RepID=A0A816FVL3_ADIRI|nr:unnamed protein product [Adineta ricciae]CAF1666318.1 unnamed protein product [Adineta ricciae]
MNHIARILLFINLINTPLLVSTEDLSDNKVIIDIVKGYTLRRIGVYSSQIVPEVIHTFIPIDNSCVRMPQTDVCLYASSKVKTSMVQLGIMITSDRTNHLSSSPFSYDSENVSKLINKEINQVLMQYHTDHIIKEAQSTAHFIDKQFYYNKKEESNPIALPTNNTVDTYSNIPHFYSTTIETIQKQIMTNKIGFDFLSQVDLNFFLSTIYAKFDRTHIIENTKQSLVIFLQTVIGQSVFLLRHCSMNSQNSLLSQPCLVISTLFEHIPADATTNFLVYRLTPLPIVSNGNKYIYSNLPKIIGINPTYQSIIAWNNDIDIQQCTFSSIVRCEQFPISMPISKSLCISQLLNDDQSVTNTCQISRSQHIDQDVINIVNNIWLFPRLKGGSYEKK